MSNTPNPENQIRRSVIMFSDIVGYIKIMRENEGLAMTRLCRHHRRSLNGNDIIMSLLVQRPDRIMAMRPTISHKQLEEEIIMKQVFDLIETINEKVMEYVERTAKLV